MAAKERERRQNISNWPPSVLVFALSVVAPLQSKEKAFARRWTQMNADEDCFFHICANRRHLRAILELVAVRRCLALLACAGRTLPDAALDCSYVPHADHSTIGSNFYQALQQKKMQAGFCQLTKTMVSDFAGVDGSASARQAALKNMTIPEPNPGPSR